MSSSLISIPFLIRSWSVMNRRTAAPDGLAQPLLVGAAVAGRDRVDERADVLVGRLGPGTAPGGSGGPRRCPRARARTARRRPGCRRAPGSRRRGSRRRPPSWRNSTLVLCLLVDELDDQPLVEVGLDVEPLGDQLGVVAGVAEDFGVGGEGDGRAGPSRRLARLDRRRAACRGDSAGCRSGRRGGPAATRLLLRALTTLAPTPCRPPATL